MYILNTALTCISGFRCICEPGYTGKNCEMVYVPCDPSPCMNNGRCMQIDDLNYECKCKSGTFAFISQPREWHNNILPWCKVPTVLYFMNTAYSDCGIEMLLYYHVARLDHIWKRSRVRDIWRIHDNAHEILCYIPCAHPRGFSSCGHTLAYTFVRFTRRVQRVHANMRSMTPIGLLG